MSEKHKHTSTCLIYLCTCPATTDLFGLVATDYRGAIAQAERLQKRWADKTPDEIEADVNEILKAHR